VLRRSYREGGKVKHENLGNVSHLPPAALEALRRSLAGETLVSAEDRFEVLRSLPHGHVRAVLGVFAIWIWSGCCLGSGRANGTCAWR